MPNESGSPGYPQYTNAAFSDFCFRRLSANFCREWGAVVCVMCCNGLVEQVVPIQKVVTSFRLL